MIECVLSIVVAIYAVARVRQMERSYLNNLAKLSKTVQ